MGEGGDGKCMTLGIHALIEYGSLESQFMTSSSNYGGGRYLPYVFTEQDVTMLSAVSVAKELLEKKKAAGTVLILNVPWHAWLLGIAGVLALVWLVLRRYGLA